MMVRVADWQIRLQRFFLGSVEPFIVICHVAILQRDPGGE
jgi:hypothetical protein